MKVALIGIGLMGRPVGVRLLNNGHKVHAYNRTKEKALELAKDGALAFDSVKECVSNCDCIILMLADAKAINETVFQLSEEDLKDKTIIQMGTIAPLESIGFQKKAYALGADYFECPVLGSRSEAQNGTLILMVGASKEKFENWTEFLKIFGSKPIHVGELGKAAALKLALNQLIAAHALSFSLSLGIIEKNGIEPDLFLDVLKRSALYCDMHEKKLNNFKQRNYDNPNFPLKHLLKDVDLILKEVEDKELDSTVLLSMREVLHQADQNNLSEKDYSSVFNIINKI